MVFGAANWKYMVGKHVFFVWLGERGNWRVGGLTYKTIIEQ